MPLTIAFPLPKAPQLESGFALLADPYGFIPKLQRRLHSDVFEARILLKRTICVSGPEAARMFYESSALTRTGAAPEPLQATLFGKGTVQGLDGERHRRRKGVFVRLLDAEAAADLAGRVTQGWERIARQRSGQGEVDIYTASHAVLADAAFAWAGIPVNRHEMPVRRADLVALFDDAVRSPWAHLRSRRARARAEQWLTGIVRDVRAGKLDVPTGSALAVIAGYEEGGELLRPRVAAAELLNIVRPIVAVAVFIQFAVHALYAWPQVRERTPWHDARHRQAFCDEVRRFYPFFPVLVANAKETFDWQGVRVHAGSRVMLDLHGTNRDARAWNDADTFRPERFLADPVPPYGLVAQGAGSVQDHHRCPGEALAVALIDATLVHLRPRLDYSQPPQDLSLDRGRIPALPRHRFQLGC